MESGLDCSVFCLFVFFGYVGLLGGSSCVTDHQYFLLLNQTYVLSNVRPEPFIVYSCLCFSLCVNFSFYNRHSYFYLLYLIFKRISHLGGLLSRMHTSDYISFTEWECFFVIVVVYTNYYFFFHLAILNVLCKYLC